MRNRLLQKKIAVSLAAGTLLCIAQVWAAEDANFQLDEITVTADRITQTVGDTPANVTVISAAELQNKGARTLADVLTGVSGVTVLNYGGTGQPAIPYVLGTDRIVVLVDGKRMNLPQGIGFGSGGIDLNTVLLADSIERIEVVHGGASVLYGADAVGGVINIITKKGADAARTAAVAAGGSDGGRYYALYTEGHEKNTYWQFSGVRDATDGQRPNSAYQGKALSFRLDQDLAAGESLTVTYDYYDSHAGIPGSLSWPSPTSFQDISRHSWSARYAKEHVDGCRIFRYYENDQIYSGENYGGFRHHNTVRVFEYQDSAKLDTANLLTWGGEWRDEKVVSTAEGNTPHDGITKAFYIQDQFSFNAAAKLTIGLRRDDSSIYGTHWLPKVAYLYRANSNTSYFANWGRVSKAPSFDDLYGDDGWGNTGNPDLRLETGWTAEVGIKTKIDRKNEATLSAFKRDLKNAIKWQPSDPSDPWSTYHPNNIAHYLATGLNASLVSKLSPVLTTDVGYTYLNSHDQNNNDIGDPRHSFHIGLNIHRGKLSQNIYGLYQDKTGTGASQVLSRFVVNTHISFNPNEDTSLFLTVNNLFDKQYQAHKDYPAEGRKILIGVKQNL